MGFRPSQVTCTAHICLLYKGTDVYSFFHEIQYNCSVFLTNAISDKGEDEFSYVDQKLQNTTGFEELKLDEIESLEFGFVTEQGPLSFPKVHVGLENGATMEDGFDSSIDFEPKEVMLSMAGRHQLTTECVWCRVEFSHEAVESQLQSDSVGLMCPTCKSKISGQVNVLDCGLSMNPHHL